MTHLKKIQINNQYLINFLMENNDKENNFDRWDKTVWLSIEKELSHFLDKVTDCMIQLGDLKKVKDQDFMVEPCLDEDVILGEDFYIEMIRPICIKKGYLPKSVKDTEVPLMKEEKKEKSKKKGGKGQKSTDQAKLKIVKDNFLKDIQLVLNSHSSERLQIEFGLRQKKIEVKLMTFFYIAYYFRINKQKQKIQESEVFELINILIKIVRIFDGLKGKSFLANDKKIQISPTLIGDLKMCIQGLKDFHNYSNRKIIMTYPKLVYYTNYDRFFPTLDIKPYPSQIQFIQSVKKAFNNEGSLVNPTLVLYKTMIGSGKTSASLALSNLIQDTKILNKKNQNLQVIYSCLISSVRNQVARYAYNKKQIFALGAMEPSIMDNSYYYPKIINSFSCKEKDVVDLIVSGLDATYGMLNYQEETPKVKAIMKHQNAQRKNKVRVGKLDKQNLVLFVDEPTAFCKSIQSPATNKLFNILAEYPPRLIILASATMPHEKQLQKTIKLISKKNPGLKVYQVESKEFQIGCQYCSFKGQIIFPHTGLKDKKGLKNIIEELKNNPFLMRLYTGPSLFFLLKKCESADMQNLPEINELPQVRQNDIMKLTFHVLQMLAEESDQVIEEVCKLSAQQMNLDYKGVEESDSDDDFFGDKDQTEDKNEEEIDSEKQDYVDFKGMLKKDAFKFLGGCLIATSNPLEFAKKHFSKWVKKIKPVKRLVEKYKKSEEDLVKRIKLIEDDKQMREEKKLKLISKLENEQPTIEFPGYKKINTIDHYKKYCPSKENYHLSMLIKPIPLEAISEELIDEVDDFVLKLLFCGVALYMEKGLSSKYLDKVEELASQSYLAYIITDQSLCYGTNFPISNVIVCDNLVQKLNMNEVFQLIGRAGRVGQSWTARAFLDKIGLEMLNKYIHSKDMKVSEEGQIFQKLAQYHLDNPTLTLRTQKAEIRYVDIENPDKRIQIVIKKRKVEDYHIFKKVVVIPYINDSKILVRKIPYKNINEYQFISTDIQYEDLPMIPNSEGFPIIDVEYFHKNQQQFVTMTLNNTYKRILQSTLLGKVDESGQVNQFKPKVYQSFFSTVNNTFVILVKCKEEFSVNSYTFQKIKSNDFQKLDQFTMQKINKLYKQCSNIAINLKQNSIQISNSEAQDIMNNHESLLGKEETRIFYKDIIQLNKSKMEKEYYEMMEKLFDKNDLKFTEETILALTIAKYLDINNIMHKLFHVHQYAREQWPKLMDHFEK